MNSHPWEHIDPLKFNDGVYYLPAMLELQPRLPHWGHPEISDLRDRLANDRPHGQSGQKLLCLLCMRVIAEKGQPLTPIWLTLEESPYGPRFRHEGGRSPHVEHEPETDTHKALKERKARTWLTAGAVSVDVEVWRPRARRRPDVVAVGPELTVAGEVQHSRERARVIQARQRSLHKAGDRVVWTTDRAVSDIAFLHAVPHLAVPALDDHRLYLRRSELEIGAGAMVFEEQRCGWSDLWFGSSPRCPVTRKLKPCGGLHLYPTLNPHAYQSRTAHLAAQFPAGTRPHLDYLLDGILHGLWLPYRHQSRVTWIPADIHDLVVSERGGGVELAESATVRRRNQAADRACERRVEEATQADVIGVTTCCGQRYPGEAGAPIINSCQLCANSPTYWRNY